MLRLLTFLLLISFCFGEETRPLVETPLGAIQGYYKLSHSGKKIAAFEGIPYAVPPIGNRRFEVPEPIKPWHGIWKASYLTKCAQGSLIPPYEAIGDEDCLYLNVYIPGDPKPGQNLNVVVHIHGGAYTLGWGHMVAGEDFLTDKNLIYIDFNYRVGILGFLTTEDEVVPGNNGMKDQVLALKWVQDNIASFGGNPNSVTLMGLSGGGASAHLHYFSKMSRGLFHRGFSQSGVTLNPWGLQKNALGKAKIVGEALGCSTTSTRVLLECLKQRPCKQIVEKLSLFYGYSVLPLGIFSPVVEKEKGAFLESHPHILLKKGEVYNIPWLASSGKHEGNIPTLFNEEVLNKNWEVLAPVLLDFNYTLPRSKWKSTTLKIKEFYCGQKIIDEDCFIYMFGDRIFQTGIEKSVKLQAKASKSPVYYYQFAYPTDKGNKYISHGADARYYYGNSTVTPDPLTQNELKMSELLLNLLVSFSSTGVPKIKGVDFKPSGFENLTYLEVAGFNSRDLKMKSVDEIAAGKFWDSLGFEEDENLVYTRDEL